MAPRQALVAVASAQLAAAGRGPGGRAAPRPVLRRRRSCAARPETVGRDAVWSGTALQRAGRPCWPRQRGRSGDCAPGRTTSPGGCSACWASLNGRRATCSERSVRAHLRPGGWDPVETPWSRRPSARRRDGRARPPGAVRPVAGRTADGRTRDRSGDEGVPVRGRGAAVDLGAQLVQVPVPAQRHVGDVRAGGEELDEPEHGAAVLGPEVEIHPPVLRVLLDPLDHQAARRVALDDPGGGARRARPPPASSRTCRCRPAPRVPS